MTTITIAIAIVFAIDIAIGIAIAIYDATEIQKCNRMQQKRNRNATKMIQLRMTRSGGGISGGALPPPDEDRATGLAEVAGGAPLPNEGPETRFDGRIAGRIAGGAPRTRVAR